MRRHHLLLVAAALTVVPSATAWAAADPARNRQWNLDVIGAPGAWATATGEGVTVAVVDSGVDLGHEDLQGRLVPGRDFVDDDDRPQDEYGHGTHVAGIIAAAADNGRGVAGVAPGARIMPIRVLGPDGGGSLDDVVAGVRYAIEHGADVVNLSLGEDTQAILGPSFADVLEEAWEAGVVPVVSAGNQFLTGSGFSDEHALVVAATDRHDGKPTYSSGVGRATWGISAPGGELPDLGVDDAVLSTYWTGTEPHQYAYLAGTSQAAPHVAGAVALLLSTGRFGPAQAVQRLLDTAKDIGREGRDPTFGEGRLDLAAALRGLQPAPAGRPATGTPAPPVVAQTATTSTTSTTAPLDLGLPEQQAVLTTTSTTAPDVEDEDDEEVRAPGRPVSVGPPLTPADDEDKALPAALAGVLALAVAGFGVRARRATTSLS